MSQTSFALGWAVFPVSPLPVSTASLTGLTLLHATRYQNAPASLLVNDVLSTDLNIKRKEEKCVAVQEFEQRGGASKGVVPGSN